VIDKAEQLRKYAAWNEDLLLLRFALYDKGDGYAALEFCATVLTSAELMIRKKRKNIAVLQIADLLAFAITAPWMISVRSPASPRLPTR
jgi:hypothetical protein